MFPSTFSLRRPFPQTAVLVITLIFLAACADQTIMTSSTVGAEEAAVRDGVVIWARGNAQDHQRADALTAVVARDPALDGAAAMAEMYHIGAGSYASLWEAANENGRPPDIVALDMEDLPEWAANGRIEPLDDCLNQYAEFDNVRPLLWPAVTWREQRWGAPSELGLHLFFFNKTKLRQLGWSPEEIESLPQRIQSGEFTLADMAETARQAVGQGIVEPGFGYWRSPDTISALNHYTAFNGRVADPAQPGKLIVSREALAQTYALARRLRQDEITPAHAANNSWNRPMSKSVWHDAVSHGQALFWDAPVWNWARWAEYYTADIGGDAFLEERIGYALQPGGARGQPGFAWAIARFYALSANRTEAEKARACYILAQATTPEVNLPHVASNSYLSVLEAEGGGENRYESDILRFGEAALPNVRMEPAHEQFGRYQQIMMAWLLAAESGKMTPAEAAEAAVAEMQAALGEDLIIAP